MRKRASLWRSRHRQREHTTRRIQEFIEQYPNQWLAIEVEAQAGGNPQTGELIYHARDRKAVWQKTKNRRRLYIVYAGPALKEGYAAAF